MASKSTYEAVFDKVLAAFKDLMDVAVVKTKDKAAAMKCQKLHRPSWTKRLRT